MEYAYAALLLHESGEELNEENISRVLDSARVPVEESRVKALVAALEDVNIDEAISAASSSDVAPPADGGDEEEITADEGGELDIDEDDSSDEDGEDVDEDDEESLGDLFN